MSRLFETSQKSEIIFLNITPTAVNYYSKHEIKPVSPEKWPILQLTIQHPQLKVIVLSFNHTFQMLIFFDSRDVTF